MLPLVHSEARLIRRTFTALVLTAIAVMVAGNGLVLSYSPDNPATTDPVASPQIEVHQDSIYLAHEHDLQVSTDGGATWNIESLDSGHTIHTPRLSSPRSDTAYVVWERFLSSLPCSRQMFFSRSSDTGQSLAEPVRISEGDYDCSIFPDIAATSDGVVVVAWLSESDTGFRTVVARRSLDTGLTWSSIKGISSSLGSAGSVSVTVTQGGDAVLAFDAAGGAGVYVSRWSVTDASPSLPELVSSPGWGWPANIEASPDGALYLVHGAGPVRLHKSLDGGITWSGSADVGGTSSASWYYYPNLAFTDGAVHVSWCDGQHISVATSIDGASTWLEPVPVDDVGGPVHCDNGHADPIDGEAGTLGLAFRRNSDGLIFVDVIGVEPGSTEPGQLILPSNANDGVNGAVRSYFGSEFDQELFDSDGNGQIQGLTMGPDGNLYGSLYDSLDNTNGQVVKINRSGGLLGSFVPPATFTGSPQGLAFGPGGELYLLVNNGQVLRFNGVSGAPAGVFASGVANPQDLAFGPDGNLYVTSGTGDSVSRFNGSTGVLIDTFVSSGAGGLDGAIGLAFGPQGDLFVASAFSNSIIRFNGTTGGVTAEIHLPSAVDTPTDLAFGPDGYLYVKGGDGFDHKVLKFHPESGALVSIFIDDHTGPFNTGMFFVDERCGELWASGHASGCFVPVDLPHLDEDSDGIDDTVDRCLETRSNSTVDANGCSIGQGFDLLSKLVDESGLNRTGRAQLTLLLRSAERLLTDRSSRNDAGGCVLLRTFDARAAQLARTGALAEEKAAEMQTVRAAQNEILPCLT